MYSSSSLPHQIRPPSLFKFIINSQGKYRNFGVTLHRGLVPHKAFAYTEQHDTQRCRHTTCPVGLEPSNNSNCTYLIPWNHSSQHNINQSCTNTNRPISICEEVKHIIIIVSALVAVYLALYLSHVNSQQNDYVIDRIQFTIFLFLTS